MMTRARSGSAVILEKLSERELQIFARIARGSSMADIGRELKLKHTTVATYRHRVLFKLGLHSNADLTLAALAAGLVNEPKL